MRGEGGQCRGVRGMAQPTQGLALGLPTAAAASTPLSTRCRQSLLPCLMLVVRGALMSSIPLPHTQQPGRAGAEQQGLGGGQPGLPPPHSALRS